MMEIERTVRPSIKARPVNDVGYLSLHDQREHARPVVGVVFEIGILDDDDVAPGVRQPGSDGGPLASVLLVKQHRKRYQRLVVGAVGAELKLAAAVQRQAAPTSLCAAEILAQPIGGSIDRLVVHNYDLFGDLRQCFCYLDQNAPDGAD